MDFGRLRCAGKNTAQWRNVESTKKMVKEEEEEEEEEGKEPQQVGRILMVGPLSPRRCQLTRHLAVMHPPSP